MKKHPHIQGLTGLIVTAPLIIIQKRLKRNPDWVQMETWPSISSC